MKNSAQASIEEDAIVIRIPIKVLPTALKVGCDMCYIYNGKHSIKVIDELTFAKDICNELNSESEDGMTSVHKLLDRAMECAIDNGSLGIEI